MPFAGQKVVESNLPSTATLSNYLSLVPSAMRGLVHHPFADDLDEQLRRVDPNIPLPTETVEEVVERIMAGVLEAAEVPKVEVPTEEADVVREVKKQGTMDRLVRLRKGEERDSLVAEYLGLDVVAEAPSTEDELAAEVQAIVSAEEEE